MAIGPAPLLAALVGTFSTALFIFLRGSAGGRAVVLLLAAILGAWAGDAMGARLEIDWLRIGDFRPVTAIARRLGRSRHRVGHRDPGSVAARDVRAEVRS